jgi:hypothetical protein
LRSVEWGDLHGLLGNALLGAVLTALKVPSLVKHLLEGFLAIGKRDPGVTISVRTPEPDGEVPRHENSLRSLMIPVWRRPGGAPLDAFPRTVNGGEGRRPVALFLQVVTFARLKTRMRGTG